MKNVFGIVGWKNSGKTVLTERLIAELVARGWKVSSVKHAHHDADIDREGTDSFRHRAAGASEVALVTGRRWALMHELRGETEPALAEIVARMSDADVILVEGFKREAHAKLEVIGPGKPRDGYLYTTDPAIVAIAIDDPVEGSALPAFRRDAIGVIADFVETHLKLKRRS